MNISLYPAFDDVFDDPSLKGVFYPLCRLTDISPEITEPLFIISTNGLWTDETNKSDFNWPSFTQFSVVNGKYQFNGNLNLYTGYKEAQTIFPLLDEDFEEKGEQYITDKLKTDSYIQQVKSKLGIELNQLDEYYIETFYTFSVNKLIFQKTGKFGAFYHILEGWEKPDPSQFVYAANEHNFEELEVNQEYMFPHTIDLKDYTKIAYTIGSEFFTDGNDSFLLYDENTKSALCVNQYS